MIGNRNVVSARERRDVDTLLDAKRRDEASGERGSPAILVVLFLGFYRKTPP